MATKGFIQDLAGNKLLPITRGELVLDADGNIALASNLFLAGSIKDASGTPLPGLVTWAERQLLLGDYENGTGGIADISNKLTLINNGLYFGNTQVHFYNNGTGEATPISVRSGEGTLSIGVNNNNNTYNVNIDLSELSSNNSTYSEIIKGLSVDKYGRVTGVTSARLNNSDIPEELSNKILDGCVTKEKEIGNDEKAIANKAYVDGKFDLLNRNVVGSLKFGGSINASGVEEVLTISDYEYHYYVATQKFTLSVNDLYDDSNVVAGATIVNIEVGDTLIVVPSDTYSSRSSFVWVPSGDDITAITVSKEDKNHIASNVLTEAIGDVVFRFSHIFNVSASGNTVTISLPQVSGSTDGYLSSSDYARFMTYASKGGVTYEALINVDTPGNYKLGDLVIGSDEEGTRVPIYGKLNKYDLTVNTGSQTNNPKLVFKENDNDKTSIEFKNSGGISITKEGNNIKFNAANEVLTQTPVLDSDATVKYLNIDNGYQFSAVIGKSNEDGELISHGLTDYSEFNYLYKVVKQLGSIAMAFESITYSLKGNPHNTEYRYGNIPLRTAISLDTL